MKKEIAGWSGQHSAGDLNTLRDTRKESMRLFAL